MRPKITFRDERRQRAAVLRVMCLSLMMVVAGVASLNVALPELARDTGATQTELQWIVGAYAVAFAALLLPAGAIGDRFGRKPILVAGLALFGLGSLAALFVHSPGELIGLRVILGVGGRPRHAGHPVRDHDGLPARGARQGRRYVGGCRRRWRGARPARIGAAARVVLVAVDLRPQRRPRGPRAGRHTRRRPADTREDAAAARSRRDAPLGRGALRARLRDHRGAGAWLERSGRRRGPRDGRRRDRRSSCCGSCGGASRCSTRGTSSGAASAPVRCRSPCSSSRRSGSSSSPSPTSSSSSASRRSRPLPGSSRWRSS